ncbi:WD40 repeat domain-containing protein [Microlunatus flavus]|uniref:PQQ-like domain-containing protein n=1 Tax=Microlunatus flavus TaxID=1036181 RepID=A0A1H9J737_9ACTN|nr:hypothetical protein [Microlunatus flavus]SEQ82549.1 hypothetical protein SAMN05421756_106108 [Microlunatus flavus]
MTGPEHLEVGGARRRPSWWVLLVVVALFGGLLVVRLHSAQDQAPDAVRPPGATAPPTAPPTPATTPWPAGRGLPSGTLYLVAGDEVYGIDVAGGLVQPLGLHPVDPDQALLTAMAPGVLVSSAEGRPRTRIWFPGGLLGQTAGRVRSAESVLPASGGDVWTRTRQDWRPSVGATWVRAGDDGAPGPRLRVRGLAVPDGAGGLLDVDRSGVRVASPDADGEVVGTSLIGVGPDGLVVAACAAGSCTLELHDRASGRTTALGPSEAPSVDWVSAALDPEALSPGSRFLAASGSDQAGAFEVRITGTTAPGVVRRTIPVGSRPADLAWLSDRWLAVTSADGLLLYDADADAVVAPSLPLQRPTQLVFDPA